MSDTTQPDETQVSVEEILAEMDDMGRAKWEAAVARVENRYLRRELAQLKNEKNTLSSAVA